MSGDKNSTQHKRTTGTAEKKADSDGIDDLV